MKRLLLGGLLFVAPLKAEGLEESWKALSKYRAVSALKAVGTMGLIYYSGLAMKKHGENTYAAVGDQDIYRVMSEGTPFGGLVYVTGKLLYCYLRPQLKHALFIK